MRIKQGAGIIVYIKHNNQLKYVFVKKRYTYTFMNLVVGSYNWKTLNLFLISSAERDELRATPNIVDLYYKYFTRKLTSYKKRSIKNKYKKLIEYTEYNTQMNFDSYLKNLKSFYKPQLEMPKGQITHGENIINAAIRELKEETNISRIQIKKNLHISEMIYVHEKKMILNYIYFVGKCNLNDFKEKKINSQDIESSCILSYNEILAKNNISKNRKMIIKIIDEKLKAC